MRNGGGNGNGSYSQDCHHQFHCQHFDHSNGPKHIKPKKVLEYKEGIKMAKKKKV